MNRFFYEEHQRDGETIILSGEDARHLLKVLRITIGEKIELCGSEGICHEAAVTALQKDAVSCALTRQLTDTEPQTKVDLAFGLLKGEKTDFVLQKATEVGIHRFLPFISERTVVREQDAKTERRQKIVRSAAAQSHRSRIPQVLDPCHFLDLHGLFAGYDNVLLFWEAHAGQSLVEALGPAVRSTHILLITGPEGGFSVQEAESAKAAGAKIVTLGPRILRAETAAVAAAALVLYQAGEMGGR